MIENYLQILEESLRKKQEVLLRIEECNANQEQILKADSVSEEEFAQSIEKKGELIEALTKLDDGFETLYAQIKEQLSAGKEQYKEQIRVLQKLIVEVTEKSVAIQVQESRNKALAEKFFAEKKSEVKQGRRNSKAAMNYYRNMKQSQVIPPQFLDKKK